MNSSMKDIKENIIGGKFKMSSILGKNKTF